jgi:nicotinamide-nucleotide amidase
LRINSYKGAADAEKIDRYFKELESIIPEALYGYEKETLAEVVAKLLVAQDLKIGTVESCTAGLLAHQLTTISGASEYYQGSILSYSNALKSKMAGVDPNLISRHGAVSQEVACAMAEGGRKILEVDICVSTTGIAGPSGGTDEKPVGLVWIAIASKEKTRVKSFQFGDNRERNLTMTVAAALNFLRYEFLSLP